MDPTLPLVRAVVVRVGALPIIEMIPTELAPLQALVDGPIELVPWLGLDLYCNEEGLVRPLPWNRSLPDLEAPIHGTFFVVRRGDDGEIRGLDETEAMATVDLIRAWGVFIALIEVE